MQGRSGVWGVGRGLGRGGGSDEGLQAEVSLAGAVVWGGWEWG